ncbi:protein NUCLEAR FUSION DEFECTIVE 2-like [Mercurialis annua]|uniref:protein NUCLEAR FUSION DEFECTIVE 2-like n=1 Tax=Mercurialis annua TaxID=3986 RepID=UPI00215EA6F4|nr:protein NUCLEAR FUSION DEFECTIVE 2-like [Mercurialis annua]
MASRYCILLVLLTFFVFQVAAENIKPSSSPFDTVLETLQKQINYSFTNVGLLHRAMTHPSFSQENNRALSIMGSNVIDTFVSLYWLSKDIDISSKELNRRVADVSNVKNSCAVDGTRLGLHKVVRVSDKTDSTSASVVCGAFRAIFGAIAIDTENADDAGSVFWGVHRRNVEGGNAVAL